MAHDIDHTRPGVAGLFFRHEALTEAGKAADRAVMATLEHYCSACGQAGASRGFGAFGNERGFWACGSDPECLSQARQMAQDARDARQATVVAPKPARAIPDLFATGEAA